MSFSMAGGGARGPEINVTPLIDVLLTLIIVFMVVVSMDKEQGETAHISAAGPEADGKHRAAAHRGNSSGVGERQSAADGEDQSGGSALGGFGDTAGEDLRLARGESGFRARR